MNPHVFLEVPFCGYSMITMITLERAEFQMYAIDVLLQNDFLAKSFVTMYTLALLYLSMNIFHVLV